MRLLRADTAELMLEEVAEGSKKYAILSHRWLPTEEEVLYADIVSRKSGLEIKKGWKKLHWCRQQALQDDLQYVWADTACIDKSSSQELTESINAMYRWYQGAEFCYVYLNDMPDPPPVKPVDLQEYTLGQPEPLVTSFSHPLQSGPKTSSGLNTSIRTERSPLLQRTSRHDILWGRIEETGSSTATHEHGSHKLFDHWDRKAFQKSEWFTRAWTLQEMTAPGVVRFYNQSWTLIGELQEMAADVQEITGVHEDALTHRRPLRSYSIAQKMSWAARRRCTKIEDRAYSLLGIMDVSMAVIYGEGQRAFVRLQDELLRVASSDDSIFAFRISGPSVDMGRSAPLRAPSFRLYGRPITLPQDVQLNATTLLADSPEAFQGRENVILASWRTGGNLHQPAVKELLFQMRAKTQRPSFWQLWKPNVTYRQVLLDCSLEDRPSTVMKLNLFAMPDNPDTFYAAADERISIVRLSEEDDEQWPYESFRVARIPETGHADSDSSTTQIMLNRKSKKVSLQLLNSSIPDSWNEADETFSIPSGDSKFEAELALATKGSATTIMRIVKNSHGLRASLGFDRRWSNGTSSRERFLQIPFLTSWNPRQRAEHRVSNGFFIVTVFLKKRYLGHVTISLVEIEHVNLGGYFLHMCSQLLRYGLVIAYTLLVIMAYTVALSSWLIMGMLLYCENIGLWPYLLTLLFWAFIVVIWILSSIEDQNPDLPFI